MGNNQMQSNDQRPPKEIIKQWWPQANDEFDANPEASSLPIWVGLLCFFQRVKQQKLLKRQKNYYISARISEFLVKVIALIGMKNT